MAWSKVQSVSAANVTTTVTLTLNGVTQGSLLVAQCSYYRLSQNNNTPPGIPTDTNGTMAIAIAPLAINPLNAVGDSMGVAMWYEKNAASGTHTVVITITNCTVGHGTLTEFSGGDGTLDKTGSATSNIVNTVSSGMTDHLSQTGDLSLIAVTFGSGTGQVNALLTDPPANYNSLYIMQNSNSDLPTEFSYRFLNSGTKEVANWNWVDNTTIAAQAAIATFLLSAPVGANVANVIITPSVTVNVVNISNSSQNLARINVSSETLNVYYTTGANTNFDSLVANVSSAFSYPNANCSYVLNGNNTITVTVNAAGGLIPVRSITIPFQNNSVLFH